MAVNQETYNKYVAILKEELVPALGCTEPIALAYACARAREILGKMPERIVVESSGNIIKNVKGVVVPSTGDMRGMETAAILGTVGGVASKKLEVLADITPQQLDDTKRLLEEGLCQVKLLQTKAKLHVIVTMRAGGDSSLVELVHTHTGIVREEKNGVALLNIPFGEEDVGDAGTERGCLNIKDIVEFANIVGLEDIKDLLDMQIQYNSAISAEGLVNSYGANVGMTLRSVYGDDIKIRAKAAAAAGSDARMSGCTMPVVINSGSGNQGMTVSLPVIEYAKELKASEEKRYRALTVSNLVAIHQKTKIGRLSAYCGAVSAAAGAGAGITYLYGGGVKEISSTITNTLANVAGIVCDGAKPSCAAKIASSVDAAILAHTMAMKSLGFNAGEGIVKSEVEQTIDSVSRMARDGMQSTDEEILKIMVEPPSGVSLPVSKA